MRKISNEKMINKFHVFAGYAVPRKPAAEWWYLTEEYKNRNNEPGKGQFQLCVQSVKVMCWNSKKVYLLQYVTNFVKK